MLTFGNELAGYGLAAATLCANVAETPTPLEFSVEGGEDG
jgi:hypothetical protein